MTRPLLPNAAARRLFLARHHLDSAPAGAAAGAALAALIEALGFVQIDSVNTLARAHDLILFSRRTRYRPAALDRLLARDRAVFENWTHDAAVIPMAFWPHWRLRFAREEARLAARWEAWQGHRFDDRLETVLARIAAQGGCTSGELADGAPRGRSGWWDWHPSKTALEYLWRTGRLAIARREGFRKVYDLTERVIPAAVRAQRPTAQESRDWACAAALDRLGFATSGEIAAFWDLVTPEEAKAWAAAERAAGRLEEIAVEGADGRLRPAFARPGTREAALALPPPAARLRVLSPFDPMLRDRARAERLFGFHYRIEIFVPAAQRRWGYYVFPLLEGERLIGRIDMAAEGRGTPSARLAVRQVWPEPGVAMTKTRQDRLLRELGRLAGFAGLAAPEAL